MRRITFAFAFLVCRRRTNFLGSERFASWARTRFLNCERFERRYDARNDASLQADPAKVRAVESLGLLPFLFLLYVANYLDAQTSRMRRLE